MFVKIITLTLNYGYSGLTTVDPSSETFFKGFDWLTKTDSKRVKGF